MTRALVLVALLSLAGAVQAQDFLSGRYLPKDAAGSDRAAPELRVTADGDGWTALFDGAPMRLQRVSVAALADMFPGVDIDASLQCAASTKLLLCHVDRGTRFEREGFTATTGYFLVIIGSAAFELVRQADDTAPAQDS
jgi:hypothetical protein